MSIREVLVIALLLVLLPGQFWFSLEVLKPAGSYYAFPLFIFSLAEICFLFFALVDRLANGSWGWE